MVIKREGVRERGSEGEVIGWGFGAQPITNTVVSGGVLDPACLDKAS